MKVEMSKTKHAELRFEDFLSGDVVARKGWDAEDGEDVANVWLVTDEGTVTRLGDGRQSETRGDDFFVGLNARVIVED